MISPRFISSALLMGLAVFSAGTPRAQAQGDVLGAPPSILVIQREFIKPGRAGAEHEKSESAFIHAMRDHHSTVRYIGLVSQSGRSRALFLNGYPTMGAWEKENAAVGADPALSADIEKATVADGDLLTSYEQSVWRYRPDLSRKPGVAKGDRYMEILEYNIKPGHEDEWEQMVAMVTEGYNKGDPDGHWDMFQSMFGATGSSYLIIIPLKNMDALDQAHLRRPKFAEAMGKDGLKKLNDMEAEAVESTNSNLFAFNPKMSYPPDRFVNADPGYWKTGVVGNE